MIGENFVGREMVLDILNKSADAVTEAEKEILRARISYLTPEEVERFGLNEKVEEPKKEGDEGSDRKTQLNEMKPKALKVLAKELEIDINEMDKEEIVEAILEAEKSE